MGLVEAGVGLVPAWGGCKEMTTRWIRNPKRPGGPMPAVSKVFEMISTANVATSAAEAKQGLFLQPEDGITMNRDRLLADAKARALALLEGGYEPPPEEEISLPGPSGERGSPTGRRELPCQRQGDRPRRRGREATGNHRYRRGDGRDRVGLRGTTYPAARARERSWIYIHTPLPHWNRIEHMLETGKPLRN